MTRILVIDDEPIAQMALAGLLAGEDFDLEFASDGPAGIAAAVANIPDIILLDVMMPGMDGYEVCKRLRTEAQMAEIPIIMITALDDRKSRLRGLAAGADDFINKPFDGMELLTRLRTIARLDRFRRLRNERARFRWVLERSEDGYVIVGMDGRLKFANPPACVLLGIDDPDRLPEAPLLEIAARSFRMEPAGQWSRWPDEALATTCLWVRPETATAPAFWLSVSEQRLVSGDAAQIVLHLHDVTDLMSARVDMRGFRTVVSHKLGTPLNAIVGWAEFAYESLDMLTLDDLKGMVVDIRAGAQRLQAEIADVLSYVETLSLNYVGRSAAVSGVMESVAAVSATLKLQDVTLTVEPGLETANLPLTASALEQILFELLENCLKFHPTHTPTVTITVASTPAGIALAVKDDGITLSPQQIQWAMTPYLQGEKYFTGEAPGMGLGIPLVSTLVWRVGGDVRISNRDDRPGVVVTVHLPLAGPSDTAKI